MASPVGHGLVGVFAYLLIRDKLNAAGVVRLGAVAACVVLANLPDGDFLLPLLFGEGVNGDYHRAFSHSLVFALAVGLFLGLAWWLRTRGARSAPAFSGLSVVLFGVLLVGSHMVLDLLGEDHRPPYGVPLWVPFSDRHVIAAWTPFKSVDHSSLMALAAPANIGAMCWDAVVLAPLLLLAWIWRRGGVD